MNFKALVQVFIIAALSCVPGVIAIILDVTRPGFCTGQSSAWWILREAELRSLIFLILTSLGLARKIRFRETGRGLLQFAFFFSIVECVNRIMLVALCWYVCFLGHVSFYVACPSVLYLL